MSEDGEIEDGEIEEGGGNGAAENATRGLAAIRTAAENGERVEGEFESNEVAIWALADDAPVTPLGVLDDKFFYLDALRQLRIVEAGKHGRTHLMALFGDRQWYPWKHFPAINKEGKQTGVNWGVVCERLMVAAARQGVIDPSRNVRGRGGWTSPDGELILHCGDRVFVGNKDRHPDRIGNYIYPAYAPIMRPAANKDIPDPGALLLAALEMWNWRRGDLDARLLLGWLVAAQLGGALDWRPNVWVTGDRSTGKSTVDKLIKYILGDGFVETSNATGAGIWQTLGFSCVPVIFDEIEAEEDDRKVQGVIEFARTAASGGNTLRGGQDHTSRNFVALSCFLFSSVLVPSLQSTDLSRLALLELNPIIPGAVPPAMDAKHWRACGAALKARLIEGWGRFAETYQLYHSTLQAGGHAARSADQFGTLLACADLALGKGCPHSDEVDEWAARVDPGLILEISEVGTDHMSCLHYLLSSTVERLVSGQKYTVGHWLRSFLHDMEAKIDPDGAVSTLHNIGLTICTKRESGDVFLGVQSAHRGLGAIFAGSKWKSRPGGVGVWVQSLRRIEGAEAVNVRFDGGAVRATRIPINQVLNDVDAFGRKLTKDQNHEDEKE